jgi:hypothetical protein
MDRILFSSSDDNAYRFASQLESRCLTASISSSFSFHRRSLKKMIFRTAIEEIIVRADKDKKTLELIIALEGRRTHATRDGAATFGNRNRDAHGGVGDHSPHGRSTRR